MTSILSAPIWSDLVVVVDLAALIPVPVPLGIAVLGGAFELLIGNVDLVTAELLVISQPRPRYW